MDDAEQSGVTGSTAGDSGCVDIPHMCAKSELSDIWRIRGFLGTEELFEEASLQKDDLDWRIIGQHRIVHVIMRVIRDPGLWSCPRDTCVQLRARQRRPGRLG